MGVCKRTGVVLAAIAFAAAPAVGCDIIYPANYVAPTNEQLISKSKAAFVGHVVGYRLDDGSTIEKDIDCEKLSFGEDWDRCWEERGKIVSAILSVDVEIRGMNGMGLFEDDRSPEPGADCGNYYADNTVFLVTGFGPQPLDGMPTEITIENWRSLPEVRVVQ